MTSASSVWPLPATPAMPTISPARTSKETPRTAGKRRSSRAQRSRTSSTVLPEQGLTRAPIEIHDAADHHLDELQLGQPGRPARRDLLAVAKDGHRVRHLHHLFEMMRNEEHRHALGDETAERLKKLPAFLRRQHGRRLVENDDACPAHQNLEDFDALLDADREEPDPLGGIDPQAELLRERRRPLDLGGMVDQAAFADFDAEEDVLRHRQ